MDNTVPFEKEEIKGYLDRCIRKWRKIKADKELDSVAMAECYIDAFQSVRISLFGELLKKNENEKEILMIVTKAIVENRGGFADVIKGAVGK